LHDISDEGKYIVTFDPLDGSSIIPTNFAVGSIFAVWPKGDLTKMTGKDMVAAIVGVYGPRTSVLIYND
jgi:sedoheptulose-bisphosphatase